MPLSCLVTIHLSTAPLGLPYLQMEQVIDLIGSYTGNCLFRQKILSETVLYSLLSTPRDLPTDIGALLNHSGPHTDFPNVMPVDDGCKGHP